MICLTLASVASMYTLTSHQSEPPLVNRAGVRGYITVVGFSADSVWLIRARTTVCATHGWELTLR